MASATEGGVTTQYQYDPYDYRIEKKVGSVVTRYTLFGEHLEAIRNGANQVLARFLRGVVIDEIVTASSRASAVDPFVTCTYHHDGLQSLTGISEHEGTPREVYRYAPFGGALSATAPADPLAPRLRYTGRELDTETSEPLYYYRARTYDPSIGRFLQEDPIGFAGGINLYAYVENNPLVANDPSGECPWCAVAGGAIGAVTGGATAYISGGDWIEGAVVGGLSGAFIGGTLGAGTTWAVGEVGASKTTAAFAGGVASGYAGGFAGSAGPQAYKHGLDSVDWSVANNSGMVGAGVAVLPALTMASATTATTVSGTALYSFGQQQAIAATLGFYEFAAGGAANLLFNDYLKQPTPHTGVPDGFQMNFPSSGSSAPTNGVYCLPPKC